MQQCWLDGNNGKANEPKTRAAAIRAIQQIVVDGGPQALQDSSGNAISVAEFEALCQRFCADPHPQVRLESLHLLRAWGSPRAVEIATQVLQYPMDENLNFSLWRICYDTSSTWLPAYRRGEISFANSPIGLLFALKAAATGDVSQLLLEKLEQETISEKEKLELLSILGTTVTNANISLLLDYANFTKLPTSLRAAALQALIVATEQRNIRPQNLQSLSALMQSAEESIALPAIRLIGLWKFKEAKSALESIAQGRGNQAASAQLSIATMDGPNAWPFLNNLLPSQSDPAKQTNLLLAMMQADLAQSTAAVVKFLVAQKIASTQTAQLINAYLTKQGGPTMLAQALEGKTLASAVASQALQNASTSGGDTKSLITALSKAGGLAAITQLSAAQVSEVIDEVKRAGNAERGEAIYRRSELQCMACHAIGPVGGVSAPNLVSIGSSAPVDYIINSLLLPSDKIKEGYATAMIQMKDGSNFTGFLTREDDKEVLLTDAAGQARTLPKASISKKETIPISMMPAGLTQSLRRDEFIDLVRFLSELGKDGDYKIQEDGTLRQWLAQQNPNGENPLVINSLVNGTLPLTEFPVVAVGGKEQRIADSIFEVLQDGEVVIETSAAPELDWKIDGKPVANRNGKITHTLPKGRHTVQVTVPSSSKAPLRVRVASDNAKPVYQGH